MVLAAILDVTRIEPKFKHPTIFKHFDELSAGESFIIDNDHDPRPLYYQLLGERGNIFTWEYVQQGPTRWQVKIEKHKNDNTKTNEEISLKQSASEQESGTQEVFLPSQDINKWELGFICDYISNTHHKYIKDTASVVSGLSEKVAQHHGLNHPELHRIAQSIPTLMQNILSHINKEEKVLFPAIKLCVSKENGTIEKAEMFEPEVVKQSTMLFQKEHVIISEDFTFIRKLTNNYQLPNDACNSYSYFYQKLEEMDNELKQCMLIEDKLLFPKAVVLEADVSK